MHKDVRRMNEHRHCLHDTLLPTTSKELGNYEQCLAVHSKEDGPQEFM